MTEVDICNLTVIDEKNWHKDADYTECEVCKKKFTFTRRRHHCRFCGNVVCDDCSKNRCNSDRICDNCVSKYNEYNIGDCIILESVRGNLHYFLLVGIVEEENYIYYIVTEKGVDQHFIQYDKTTRDISFTLGIGEELPNFHMDRSYKKIMKKGPSGIFDNLLKTSILFDSRTNECIMGGKKFKQGDTITFDAEGSPTDIQSSPHSPHESLKYTVTALVRDIIPSNFSTDTPTKVVLKVTSGNISTYTFYNHNTDTYRIPVNSEIILHNNKLVGERKVNYREIDLIGKVLKPANISVIRVNNVTSQERQGGGNKHRKNKNKKSKRVVKRYISKRYKNRRNKVTKRSKRSKKLRR